MKTTAAKKTKKEEKKPPTTIHTIKVLLGNQCEECGGKMRPWGGRHICEECGNTIRTWY